jgi:hypothetical protein
MDLMTTYPERRLIGCGVARLAALAACLLVSCLPAAAQQPPAGSPTQIGTQSPAPVDPAPRMTAGPITRPVVIEIAKDTYFINEFGMDAQYVLVGEKRTGNDEARLSYR